MHKLALAIALVAALAIAAAPASAARKLKPCHTVGMAATISQIHKRGVSCVDARVLIRSVESHGSQCRPYRQQTIAPFRECVVTPTLSVGSRNFFCRSAFETSGDNKRYWDTTCKSFVGDVIRYRRDGSKI